MSKWEKLRHEEDLKMIDNPILSFIKHAALFCLWMFFIIFSFVEDAGIYAIICLILFGLLAIGSLKYCIECVQLIIGSRRNKKN